MGASGTAGGTLGHRHSELRRVAPLGWRPTTWDRSALVPGRKRRPGGVDSEPCNKYGCTGSKEATAATERSA
ncbi:hypothetical protein MRX96_042214 [Rhipicephalus microplus]